MGRAPRKISETGVYHVILRGNNKQTIFLEDGDYQHFLDIMRKHSDDGEVKVFAYCLMSNHVHLLLKPCDVELSNLMHDISESFVIGYNKKYSRVGSLFQGRFLSEPIEDLRGFLAVWRYILQNPIKAHMEEKMGTYPWTSYGAYLKNRPDGLTSIGWIKNEFSDMEKMRSFLGEITDEEHMEYEIRVCRTDSEVAVLMGELTGINTPTDMQRKSPDEQIEIIKVLLHHKISKTQIARITGESFKRVSKIASGKLVPRQDSHYVG